MLASPRETPPRRKPPRAGNARPYGLYRFLTLVKSQIKRRGWQANRGASCLNCFQLSSNIPLYSW